MYKRLYEPISDINAYLDRIHWQGPLSVTKCDLDKLIFHHQCSIPFENLDIAELEKEISLETNSIFKKVVLDRRGGYCFELNALFSSLLRQLGFDAYSCFCRITRMKNYTPPSLHQGIIVNLDGCRLFCDVGFGGPMPAGSLIITENEKQEVKGEIFWFSKFDSYWWTLYRNASSGSEDVLQLTLMPQEPVDFLGANEYCSKNPNSYFKGRKLVNLRTTRGSLSLTDNVFSQNVNGVKKERSLLTHEEYKQVLKDEFGIVLKS